MNRRFALLILVVACVGLVPFRAPAPLVYTAGEGWSYEPVGGEGKWRRARAKDQMDVAQAAFNNANCLSVRPKSRNRIVNTG